MKKPILEVLAQSSVQKLSREEQFAHLLKKGYSVDEINTALHVGGRGNKMQHRLVYILVLMGVLLVVAGVVYLLVSQWHSMHVLLRSIVLIASNVLLIGVAYALGERLHMRKTALAAYAAVMVLAGTSIFAMADVWQLNLSEGVLMTLWVIVSLAVTAAARSLLLFIPAGIISMIALSFLVDLAVNGSLIAVVLGVCTGLVFMGAASKLRVNAQ